MKHKLIMVAVAVAIALVAVVVDKKTGIFSKALAKVGL